ncbi:hypothetical protein HU200_017788 [Digitaria exilis]|uniref:Uncharacterized protein n=1 Tax=Digitaria exilis TaxID=1010633 RepID=A0A835F5W3_9POAL|nr:hypothetical protein HU200_017788 [Digitaria exilis]
MRCKKHPHQASGGGGGVCATCLRDRLLALAAERNGASSPPAPAHTHAPPPAPPPVAFPRSVSPYLSRRKSDAGAGALRHHPSILFFRTPQVGPAGFSGGGALEEGDIGYEYEKRRAGKFSVLATLFGHHHHRSSDDKHPECAAEHRKKHSWLAGIIPRRLRRKKTPAAAAASFSPPSARPRRSSRRVVVSNRGLSPERDYSHGGSGDESSSPAADPPPWQPSPSPMRKTPCRRRQNNTGMPSGFAVCLSPLVRPSPGRRHRHAQPPDPGAFSCELRPSPIHNLAPAASVARCRSRKLADGGRFW